jgi:integrase/recombinase XerD
VYAFVYTLKMALLIYRRHAKRCTKGYEQNDRTFPPRTSKEIKADCECPIVCSGTTPSQSKKLRHLSLDTRNWDKARKLVKQLEDGSLAVDPAPPDQGFTIDQPGVTVEEAIARFLKKKGPSGENIEHATLRKHEVTLLDRIVPFCKNRGVQLISAFDDAAIVEECFLSFKNLNPNHNRRRGTLVDKPLSDRTRVKELDRYRSFLRYCKELGWLKHVHASNKNVIKPPSVKPSPKYGLEPLEELQVFDAIQLVTNRGQLDQYNSKELRALVMVMRYTGLRISDAVTLDHTQLVRRESGPGYAIKIMSMQKTDDWVRIPITLETAEALHSLKFKGEKDRRRFWFYTGNGECDTAINNWRERIDNLLKLAQRPPYKPFLHHATPHTLRHTFAISALNNGADIKMVSRWLGHSNTKITEAHYSHAIRATHVASEQAYDQMMAKQQLSLS